MIDRKTAEMIGQMRRGGPLNLFAATPGLSSRRTEGEGSSPR